MQRKIFYYLDELEQLKAGEYIPPVSCEIDPSNRCQLRCNFCFYKESNETGSGRKLDMSMGMYINLISELKKQGTKSITFTGGGEPLMNPRFNDMVFAALARKFEIGLVTNGVLLNRLKHKERFKFIRVSLSAGTQNTFIKVCGRDFFDRVQENVLDAVREDAFVGLSYVIGPDNDNYYDIGQISEFAQTSGVRYLQFKPALLEDGTCYKPRCDVAGEKIISTDRYVIEGNPCMVAHLIGIVGADGNVYYCCQHRGKEKYWLGNLATDSFEECWKRRINAIVDFSDCTSCRYMNYYKEYTSLQGEVIAGHKNFL